MFKTQLRNLHLWGWIVFQRKASLVLGYVVLVATVNFLLGFALAMWQERGFAFAVSMPRLRLPRKPAAVHQPAAQDDSAEGSSAPTKPEPAPAPTPAASSDDADDSLDGAFRPCFELDLLGYRRRLTAVQERAAFAPAEQFQEIANELSKANERWLTAANPAAETLRKHLSEMGDGRACADRLLELLADLARLAEESASLPPGESIANLGRRLYERSGAILQVLETLRDDAIEARLAVLHRTGGLASLQSHELVDPQTGLSNRLGLEGIQRGWRQETPGIDRPWCIAVVDIDGFTELNQRLGAAACDALLTAFGRMLDDLLRKDRGFDRIGRHRGDSFVLFLGDTDADDGVNAAERIRQNVESSAFALPAEEIEVTAGIGLAYAGPGDSLATVIYAAEQAALAAKEQGGNCTCRDTDTGPHKEEVRPYQVKGRVVEVAL
jgi:diguanylate cyclase (GGDEF)-like protein